MPNDLTPTTDKLPAKPTMPQLSEALTSLLDSAGSPDRAVAEILAQSVLVAEARQALPALQHVATAKAGREGVKAVVGKRFALYPQPQRSDGEWAAWWEAYFDVLGDVPLASLEAAMRAYQADPQSEFMPKPGRLRELAFTTPCRSLLRYMRAKRVVDIADAPPQIQGPKPDAADVKAMLAEFNARAMPDENARTPLPSIAGKPDEGGLTPEMRALIARRREDLP